MAPLRDERNCTVVRKPRRNEVLEYLGEHTWLKQFTTRKR